MARRKRKKNKHQNRIGSSAQRRVMRNVLMIRQNGRCHYCLTPMRLAEFGGDDRPDVATFEHIIPRSVAKGLRGNVVLACLRCNRTKANRTEEEFVAELEEQGLRFRCITGNVSEP